LKNFYTILKNYQNFTRTIDFIDVTDITARYRKFLTFSVVFRLPPEDPLVWNRLRGFNLMFLL